MIKLHKPFKASLVVSVVLAVSLGAINPQANIAAASNLTLTSTAVQTATIEASVRLRTAPSTSSNVLSYLKQGDIVTILEKTNDYFYKVRTADGQVGYTSSMTQYISLTAAPETVSSSVQTALIQASVRLRSAPSTSSNVLTYLNKGDVVTILEKTNNYFYKVSNADGIEGYTSSSTQFISLNPVINGDMGIVIPQPIAPVTPISTKAVEDVINAGLKYLGTPYEYGSSRNNTDTFDCSDFVRQMFLDGGNVQLPADSRQQGEWVKVNSKAVDDITALKRGDLMFFMSYYGSSASDYAAINKSTARITHVALYLGNGQILHTYSTDSGGVKVSKLTDSWTNRFLYGGSVIR